MLDYTHTHFLSASPLSLSVLLSSFMTFYKINKNTTADALHVEEAWQCLRETNVVLQRVAPDGKGDSRRHFHCMFYVI